MQIFSSFTLKIMAIIFMAMDHIYTYIGGDTPIWFGYLGKLAAPIFFYLIVEGFYHTRSRKNYMKRLFSMAVFMIFIDVIFKIHNNIFLSLGFGVLFMYFIEYAKENKDNIKKRRKGILMAVLSAFIVAFFTEASIYGIGMIIIFYFLREKKIAMAIAYVIFSLFFTIISLQGDVIQQLFVFDYQWMMVFAIVPILMYNQKLGISNKFVKWMFYWFYPIHLIIIVTIANIIGPVQTQEPIETEPNTQIGQQQVENINANIEFINDENVKVILSENPNKFKSVYIISLYEEQTNKEVMYDTIQQFKKVDVIEKKIKTIEGNKLVKGNTYILSVYDAKNEKLLFENKIVLD